MQDQNYSSAGRWLEIGSPESVRYLRKRYKGTYLSFDSAVAKPKEDTDTQLEEDYVYEYD